MTKSTGPTFGSELQAAGVAGLPFSWSDDGTLTFGDGMTNEQKAVVQAVYDAHDPDSLVAHKKAKGEEINRARLAANNGAFTHAGKVIACDPLSRSDIDGVANHIALFGAFPPAFPDGWNTVDNQVVPMPSIEDFKAFYQSMTAQGTANFNYAQQLKLAISAATTQAEIDAIAW